MKQWRMLCVIAVVFVALPIVPGSSLSPREAAAVLAAQTDPTACGICTDSWENPDYPSLSSFPYIAELGSECEPPDRMFVPCKRCYDFYALPDFNYIDCPSGEWEVAVPCGGFHDCCWIGGGGGDNLMDTGDCGDVLALNTSDKDAVLAAFASNPKTYAFDKKSGSIIVLNCIGQVLKEVQATKEVAAALMG